MDRKIVLMLCHEPRLPLATIKAPGQGSRHLGALAGCHSNAKAVSSTSSPTTGPNTGNNVESHAGERTAHSLDGCTSGTAKRRDGIGSKTATRNAIISSTSLSSPLDVLSNERRRHEQPKTTRGLQMHYPSENCKPHKTSCTAQSVSDMTTSTTATQRSIPTLAATEKFGECGIFEAPV